MEFMKTNDVPAGEMNKNLLKVYPIFREWDNSNEANSIPFSLWFDIKGYKITEIV